MGGADINVIQLEDERSSRRDIQEPALHIVIRRKNKFMIKPLLDEFGTDPLATDLDGKTALQRIQEIGHQSIIRIVKKQQDANRKRRSILRASVCKYIAI